jgi:hypothetical protein
MRASYVGWGDRAHQKVTTVYKRACKQRGEDPILTGKSTSMKVYREEYVAGFISGYYNMLWRARNAGETGGQALVLAGRKDDVDEAFYREFPHLRPKAAVGNNGEGRIAQRRRKQREYRPTKADIRAMERRNSAAGRAGAMAGKRAAEEVQVQQSRKPGALDG